MAGPSRDFTEGSKRRRNRHRGEKYIKGRGRKRNANVEKGTVVSRNQNGGGISVGLEGDLSRGRHQKTQREERNMIEKGKRTVKHISGCQIYSASYSGHSD